MSRKSNKIIGTLAAGLVAAALTPATSVAQQSGGGAYGQHLAAPATPGGGAYGQHLPPPAGQENIQSSASASDSSSGPDEGTAAIIVGSVLGVALIGVGGRLVLTRRRDAVQKPRTTVASS